MAELPRHLGLGALITKIAKSTQLTPKDVHNVVTELIKAARSYAEAKYRIKMPPDILRHMSRCPKPPPVRLRHRNRKPIMVINNKIKVINNQIKPKAFCERLPQRLQIDID